MAQQYPPNNPSTSWRDFIQVNHRHENFDLLETKHWYCCIACDTRIWVALSCCKCNLILCSQCTSEIVRPDVRGNLKLVISTQARWKFGYSQEFILREKSEVIRDYRNGIGYLEMIPPLERKSFMRNDFDNGGIDIVECDCADSGCCASDASVWTDSESHSSIFMDQSDQSNSDSEWQDIENDDGLISPQDRESSSDTEDDFNRILLTNMRNANLTEFSERTREGAQNSIFKSEDLNLDGKISNDSEKESLWD